MTKSESLCKTMTAQVELMDAVLVTMEDTRDALLHSDRGKLAESTRKEEELLKPFYELERKRATCVRDIAGVELNMTTLLARIPEGERTALEALSIRMRNTARRIVETNSRNAGMLRTAQRIVNETLRIITDDHRRSFVDERV